MPRPAVRLLGVLLTVGATTAGAQDTATGRPRPAAVRVDSLHRRVTTRRRITDAEIAEMQRRGTAVDTILVDSVEFNLRVGEAFPFERFRIRARDTTGAVVPHFAPVLVDQSGGVVRFGRDGVLRAAALGAGIVYIEAIARDPGQDPTPRRPSTRVEFVVRP